MSHDPADVAQLLGAYGALLDTGRSAAFAALFAEGGSLAIGEREIRGAEALEAFAEGAVKGVHQTGLPFLDDDGRAVTPFLFVNRDTGQLVGGHYRDTFARDAAGRLVFARRDIELAVRVAPPA